MKLASILDLVLASASIPLAWYSGCIPCRPVLLNLFVTERCNLRCRMCDVWQRADPRGELSSAELERLLADVRALGVRGIAITGGEPLLRRDILQFVACAKALGFVVHMSSNGTMIREASMAERVVASGLDAITISLDGLARSHDRLRSVEGAHARAMEAIRLLLAARERGSALRVGTSTVIMRANLDEVDPLARTLLDTGVDAVAFQPFTANLMNDDRERATHMITAPADLEKLDSLVDCLLALKRATGRVGNSYAFLERIPAYFRGTNRVGCFAGYFNVDVDSKGNVLPCLAMRPAGNVRAQPLRAIWNGEAYRQFRERVLPSCHACFIGCYGEPSLLYNPRFMLSSARNMLAKLARIEGNAGTGGRALKVSDGASST